MTATANDQLSPDGDLNTSTKYKELELGLRAAGRSNGDGDDIEFGVSPLTSPATKSARHSSRGDIINEESPIHVATRAKSDSLRDAVVNRSQVHSIRVRQGSRVDSLSESFDSRQSIDGPSSQDDTIKVNEKLAENPL